MVKKTTMEERMEKMEQELQAMRLERQAEAEELRKERQAHMDEMRRLLVKQQRRRRGRSRSRRPREESGEAVEPATAKKRIAMREPEVVEEKNLGNMKLQISDVVKSMKNQEDEDLKTEQHKIGDDLEPHQNQVVIEAQREEGLTLEAAARSKTHDLVDKLFSLAEGKKKLRPERTLEEAELNSGEEELPPAEPPPSEVSPTSLLSSKLEPTVIAMGYGREWKEKEISVGWKSRKVDRVIISLGRAQIWVSNSDHFNIERGVSKVISKRVEKLAGFNWTLTKMGHTFNSIDLTQTLNTIFAQDIVSKSASVTKSTEFNIKVRGVQVVNEVEKRKHNPSTLAVLMPTLDQVFNYFDLHQLSFLLLLQACLYTQSNFNPMTLETSEQFFERSQEPRKVELRDSIILDRGEVKGGRVGRIFCHGSQLHFKGVGKLIKLLVGAGRYCGSEFMQLINIPIMVEPTCVHEWDPGGLQIKGWDPSGFKREKSDSTNAMECDGSPTISTQIWDQLFSVGLVILKTPSLFMNLEAREFFYGALSSSAEAIAIERYETFSGPSIVFAMDQGVITPLLETLLEGSEWAELISSAMDNLAKVLVNYIIVMTYGRGLTVLELKLPCMRLGVITVRCLRMFVKFFSSEERIDFLIGREKLDSNITLLLVWQQPPNLIQYVCKHGCILGTSSVHKPVWTVDDVVQKKREGPPRSEGLNNGEIYSPYLADDLSTKGIKEYMTGYGQGQAETNLKPWDPGGNCYTSYITWSLCFRLWNPGGRPLSLKFFPYLHLEDKVNFKGGSIDENLALPNKFGKGYSRRGRIGINYRIRYLGGKSCNNLAESARWECAEVHA